MAFWVMEDLRDVPHSARGPGRARPNPDKEKTNDKTVIGTNINEMMVLMVMTIKIDNDE